MSYEGNSDSLSEIRDEEAIAEHLREPGFGRKRSKTDKSQPKQAFPEFDEKNHKEKKKPGIRQFFEQYDSRRVSHFIPCLYLPYAGGSSKLLIYFHANAEDIVLSHELLDCLRAMLRVHVIAVEYPGYGLYTGEH